MRPARTRCCSYLVPLDATATDAELRVLASYLSTLGLAGCEVIVVDEAPAANLEERKRLLRWVSRHVPATGEHLLPSGGIDVLQAALDLAGCEKIIVAAPESRYTAADLTAVCSMLEGCDAVTPGEFVHPLPWWSGIDAGRMLLQRGLDQSDGYARTFAFRKSAWRPLLGFEPEERFDHLRRLVTQGAELHQAKDLFVRREPTSLAVWLRLHSREAAADAAVPFHAALFAGILPILAILTLLGGAGLAATYAGMIAAGSVIIAVHGRSGAGAFIPLRACLFAPLWILARAFSVYWGLVARLRRGDGQRESDEWRVRGSRFEVRGSR